MVQSIFIQYNELVADANDMLNWEETNAFHGNEYSYTINCGEHGDSNNLGYGGYAVKWVN